MEQAKCYQMGQQEYSISPPINDNQCRTFLFARFICCYEDITERSKQFNVHTAAAAAQKNTIKRQQKMSI